MADLFTLNTSTGAATLVGQLPQNSNLSANYALAFEPINVPEPASLMLVATALPVIALASRHFRRAA